MITNERQYKITRKQLANLSEVVRTYDIKAVTKRTGSTILAKAELDALKSEVEVLSDQLSEYESLKSGMISILTAKSLDELPRILVQARIVRGLTQGQLAKQLKLKEQQIQRYESEMYASTSLQRLAEVADALQLNISEVAEFKQVSKGKHPAKSVEIDWHRFPVAEMYRRGWFEDFTGSLKDVKEQASFLAEAYVTSVIQKPATSRLRRSMRLGSGIDLYSLRAWECRILHLANEATAVSTYDRAYLNENWLRELVQESRHENGPIRAYERLAEVGITLIIEPHLRKTYLDGAAFIYGGKPIIGMTLRYDRLDNFWFVLFHELIHIKKHLRVEGLVSIFDDFDAEADEFEREADKLALEALIAEDEWEMTLSRYVQNDESIASDAEKLKIHRAIIAGRIRYESNNYIIFGNLIGQGQVRKHFHNIRFG